MKKEVKEWTKTKKVLVLNHIKRILKANKESGWTAYICIIASQHLKLIDISCISAFRVVFPEMCEALNNRKNEFEHNAPYEAAKSGGCWSFDDYDSRIKFINKMIKDFEK